ncbi:putative late blight resistance protein homolog R1B-16 [Salvia hispanica]|uniref:putative late blight resistance protein homolog R1B-16 n=1 Tax=Salvia hispanica TaxID=49212 RepID=UPI002008F3BF|nr:putative late blight resistance protein homolog R1B-16 [Salvia hispanica]
MAYKAVESLQQTLRIILLRDDDDLITPPVKQQIVSIHDKAVVLQFNLRRFPDKETIREVAIASEDIIQYLFSPQYLSNCRSIHQSGRQLPYQLENLAKKLESTVGYVIDCCNSNDVADSDLTVSSSSRSAHKSQVEDLTVATELIVRNSNWLRRLWGRIKSAARASLVDEKPSDSPSLHPPAITTKKDVVVGFDEDMIQMRSQLISHDNLRLIGHDNLKVLPIVGMAGIGKSALAKYIYDDPSIAFHFDIRAWVTISQDYSIASILSKILASLKDEVDQLEDYSKASILSKILASLKDEVDHIGRDSFKGHDVERLKLNKLLSGRRYLIVMDDMWSAEAWRFVQRLFPNYHNGSRIILTTRLMDLAIYYANFCNTFPVHTMRFLDDEQSWRLFNHKVFGNQDCPLDLRSVGEKIVKGRGGLPLSIVTVAGLLSRIPRTPKLWQQIEVNDGQLGSILSLSYNHLPPHLRKCFLYMAAFPQDYDIHASELIKLWLAEGFLECRNDTKSIEVVAEECLEDLIKQSLVLVTSWKINGKTKSFRLHSVVRDFCVRQAGEEKFLLPVMDYLPTPILRKHFLPQVLQNHPRISVSWHDLYLRDSMHSSCTTSIICIPHRGYRPICSVQNFISLRVLHVLRRNDRSYWELGQVFELIYLTYLASYIPDSIVPPIIAKLQNLQTLIIYRFEVRLPVEIWSLRHLRHLIAFSFHPLPLPKGATLCLKNLQMLSTATNFVCSERMVDMIPNIKKLGICYSEVNFDASYHLDNLIHLLQLEKLKLKMHDSSMQHSSFVPHPYSLSFPLSLKKLELRGRWVSWNDMTIVGSLPNLQVLKLKNYACYGEHWGTIQGDFRNLKHLLIDESNLKCWTTDSSHFPRLQSLTLHCCPYLDEIPANIGEIPTLQLIEIDVHNQSLLYSAKKIQEKQLQNWGKDNLKVVVKHS